MHVRWSTVRGMPVLDDETQETIGFLMSPLIGPDTGRILGFFTSALSGGERFLSVLDILAWGTRVHVRSADKLAPPEELIRLQSSLEDPRRVLGQHIRMKRTRKSMGVCGDIQFDTRHFTVEWLFPRSFFFFKQPVPVSEIAEITQDAIWIQDPFRGVKEKAPKEEKAGMPKVLPEQLPTAQRIKKSTTCRSTGSVTRAVRGGITESRLRRVLSYISYDVHTFGTSIKTLHSGGSFEWRWNGS